MKLYVFIQQDNGEVNRNSLESLCCAQKIAKDVNGSVTAIIFGDIPDGIKEYNLTKVLSVSNDHLSDFNPLLFVEAMSHLIKSGNPDMILFGHTYQVRDWVPRLSAKMDIPFISDCIGYKNENGFQLVRQIYQGKINSDIAFDGPALASIQSGAYRIDEIETSMTTIQNVEINLSNFHNTIHQGEKFQEAKGTVDLSKAEIILAVGRGIGKEDNLPLVKDLANALGAELGSSRPIVDNGWLELERQVGSSGQTVSPKLYLAVGISGAIQHQVGMKGSDNIVAINKDGNAPIFEIADYGIVADMFEIIPKLTEAIREKT